jgi:hypothetical protein
VDQNDKRDLYNGFGDGLARAFEYAVTPAIFGVLGYLLDRAIGTVPVLTIVLALICVVGMFLKTWYTYDLSRGRKRPAHWPPAGSNRGTVPIELTAHNGTTGAVERQVAADIVHGPSVPGPADRRGDRPGVWTAPSPATPCPRPAQLPSRRCWLGRRTSLAPADGRGLFTIPGPTGPLTVAVLAITGQSWFSPIPLCATLVLTHLGLLIWETRYVSATLAYPGLKPRPAGPGRSSAARARAAATQKGS